MAEIKIDKLVKNAIEFALNEMQSEIGMTFKECYEKQVPKKVIDRDKLMFGRCPICKQALLNMTYCVECGQRLDWSD